MQQDDRLMSLLTAIVVIVAIGTLAVSGPSIVSGLRSKEPLVLRNDEAIVRTSEVRSLEVLANDGGVDDQDRGNLMIMARPACGEALVSDGTITYIGGPECLGRQAFSYCVSREGVCPEAVVNVMVLKSTAKPPPLAAVSTPAKDQVEKSAAPKLAPATPAIVEKQDKPETGVAAVSKDETPPNPLGYILTKPDGPRAPTAAPRFPVRPTQSTKSKLPEEGSLKPASQPVPTGPAPFAASPAIPLTPGAPVIASESGLADLRNPGSGQTVYIGRVGDALVETQEFPSGSNSGAEQPAPVVALLATEFLEEAEATATDGVAAEAAALSNGAVAAPVEAERIAAYSATEGDDPNANLSGVYALEADPLADSLSPDIGPAPSEPVRVAALATAVGIASDATSPDNQLNAPTTILAATLETAVAGQAPVIEAPEADPFMGGPGPKPGDAPSELVTVALLEQDEAEQNRLGVVDDAGPAPLIRTAGAAKLISDAVAHGEDLDLDPANSRPQIASVSSQNSGSSLVEEITASLIEVWSGAAIEPHAISPAGAILPGSPPADGVGMAGMSYQTEEAPVGLSDPATDAAKTLDPPEDGAVLVAAATAIETVNTVDCKAPKVAAQVRQAAMVEVSVESACAANEVVRILHEDIPFSLKLDASGRGAVTVPAMTETASIAVVFADGDVHLLEFDIPDAGRLHRIALVWTDAVDLDLHAFEYGAAEGGKGHVWSGAPRGFSQVRRKGGGFFNAYPGAEDGYASVEVYSFWKARRTRAGAVKLALDFVDRGVSPAEPFCGEGVKANPEFRVYRSDKGVLSRSVGGVLASVDCGAQLSSAARYNQRAVRDLVIGD